MLPKQDCATRIHWKQLCRPPRCLKPARRHHQRNRFRHSDPPRRVADLCCPWSYADVRGECITCTPCVVQVYYVNSSQVLVVSVCVSVCVFVRACVCACACSCRLGWYIRIYMFYCRSGFVINLPADYCVPAAVHVSTCTPVFACTSAVVGSRQGHSERLSEMKDINNAWKYWWLPLEECMPYAKLMHMINHSSRWLTTPLLFPLSSLILFLSSHLGHKQSRLRWECCSSLLLCAAAPNRSKKPRMQMWEFLMKAALDNTSAPPGPLVWK